MMADLPRARRRQRIVATGVVRPAEAQRQATAVDCREPQASCPGPIAREKRSPVPNQ